MKNFTKGQMVCCIDASQCEDCGSQPPLRKGTIYEVDSPFFDFEPCVMLVGVTEVWGRQNTVHDGYESTRFKPVEPTKIEIFKQLLEPAPVKKAREPEPVK